MRSPPKETGGSLQPPINKRTPPLYELDEGAQEQFARHARWLLGEFLRTGNEKHLRALDVHNDAARDYRPKLARLARGRPLSALIYELKLVEIIGEDSSRTKGNARQSRNKKGGSAQ